MVSNAYIPSFAASIFDRYTEPRTMEAFPATPIVTRTLAPSPPTTFPTPTTRTPSNPSINFSAVTPAVAEALREIATTARSILVLLLGSALVLLVLYTVCAATNLALTRFTRGDPLSRVVARALGEWMAGIKTAWEEGWGIGVGKNSDVRGAGAGVGWTSVQGEKLAVGRGEERFLGGQVVGRKSGEVEVVAVAKCEISVGNSKGLEQSETMEGGELVENHWGEGRK